MSILEMIFCEFLMVRMYAYLHMDKPALEKLIRCKVVC